MKSKKPAGNDKKMRESYNVISTLREVTSHFSVISITLLM